MNLSGSEAQSNTDQWLAAEAMGDVYLLRLLYLKEEMMRVRLDMRQLHGNNIPRAVSDPEIWAVGNQITARAVALEYLFDEAGYDPDEFATLVAHYEQRANSPNVVEG